MLCGFFCPQLRSKFCALPVSYLVGPQFRLRERLQEAWVRFKSKSGRRALKLHDRAASAVDRIGEALIFVELIVGLRRQAYPE